MLFMNALKNLLQFLQNSIIFTLTDMEVFAKGLNQRVGLRKKI